MDARAWGIAPGYHDIAGTWHEAPADSVRAMLDAMGADGDQPPETPVWVVRTDELVRLDGRWELRTEDGGSREVDGSLPPDVPLGYHMLHRLDGGRDVRLIVTPPACHLPAGLRTWGLAVQLPTLRSAAGWGMGDLADLRELAEWSRRDLAAGMLLLNPLHAAPLGLPQEPSPYSPSTRRYRNLLYLRIEEVPGFDPSDPELARLAAEARAANTGRLIDRDAVYRSKVAALERLWDRFPGSEPCERYCRAEGDSLLGYATFCALAEERPAGTLPHPASAEVRAFEGEHADRIAFFMWVQWLLDEQLRRAGRETALMQDLAVGFHPDGADAWQYQDCVVQSARVGAPPDEFNTAGQDWGLPPFDPWRLRTAGYEPFIQTIRNGFRHAGGLRVDHVMGLFRLFWVPLGGTPSDGVYVRYPWSDLLGIVALESVRAQAYVVGEDLGTVEEHVRDALADRAVLSYRLLWFEDRPPAEFPERALSAVTTHDLPTVAGLWTGYDVEDQRAAGVEPNLEATQAIRERLRMATGAGEDTPLEEVVASTYGLLAEARSAVIVATVEDALVARDRPNLPGTTGESRPNWSIALPATLEELKERALPRRLATVLARDGAEPGA